MEPVQYSASTAENIQKRLQQSFKGSREGWTYAIFWKSSCDYSGSLLGWGGGHIVGEGDKGKDHAILALTEELEYRTELFLELNSWVSGSTPTPDDIDEDVTDADWLFLVSMTRSFCVDSGGLPIQAYLKNSPVWVSGAERLANSGFDRASQGLVFGLQTLVCIPLANGVVELGSTEIINQNSDLIHKVWSLWKKEDDSSGWTFWRRVYSTCDASLFVSDVQIGRKVKGLKKDKINEQKERKLNSKVWDEFTKSKGEDGKQLAICNHCRGEFDGSSKNGTTHLKKHLESMKCRATRNGGDGNGDKSTKTRDLASPVVIKERSYLLTMEMEEQNAKNKRKRKSKVWDEFTWSQGEDGKQWAVCNHCGRVFDGSSKKGTTHLNDHLNTKGCQDKRNGGDGNGDKSTKTRDFASPVVIK